MKTLFLFLLLAITSSATLAEWECNPEDAQTSLCGEPYIRDVQCNNVSVSLAMNVRTVEQPTLTLDDTEIKLDNGPSYSGPVCLKYRGRPVAGFTEWAGNAYQYYYLVDLATFKMTKISYAVAKKIGLADNN